MAIRPNGGVQVFRVRTSETPARQPGAHPRHRASDARLLLLKALVLLAGLAALLCAGRLQGRRLGASLTNEWQGHSIRFPVGWWAKKEGFRLATVVSEAKSDHMQLAPALLPSPEGIQIRLERFALESREDVELLTQCATLSSLDALADGAVLARLAGAHVGIRLEQARLRRTALMGRPAVEVAGPRSAGWGAVIAMKDGNSVVLLQLAAPSWFEFERAATTWRAVARSARSVPARSYKALGEPPADPRDPGWGPGEEMVH